MAHPFRCRRENDTVAIVILEKSRCALCGEVLEADDDIVLFPPGLFSPSEPVFVLNDAGVHQRCLDSFRFGAEASRRREEHVRRVDPL